MDSLFVLLVALWAGADVICARPACNQLKHIESIASWLDEPRHDFKGDVASEQSKARAAPFLDETEEGINKQINTELFVQYTYTSMAYHFERDDVNLPGFHKFFKESAEKEDKHAQKFMEYQNKRGGRVKLHSILQPCRDQWGTGLDAMIVALQLERSVYRSLLDLHIVADKYDDAQFQDFLDSNFLGEQVDSIKQLANYVNTLARLNGTNYALGEYQFDKITLGGKE